MHCKARYRKGDSVLISDVDERFGKAALFIAQAAEADVFAISKTATEFEMLTKEYNLDPSHILRIESHNDCASAAYKGMDKSFGSSSFDSVLHTGDEALIELLIGSGLSTRTFISISSRALSEKLIQKVLRAGPVWGIAYPRDIYRANEKESLQ